MNSQIIKSLVYCLLTIFLLTSFTCELKERDRDETISFSSLLKEMTDRERLTYFPDPKYRLLQASSWDRSEEKGPQDTTAWFANQDYNHWIREEKVDGRTEYVIMEAEGPGAITRWWIPQEQRLKHRTLRIYLDGNPTPVIEENYHDFINGSSYIKWPFAFSSSDEKDARYQYSLPVGHPKQMGADLYLPIPFAKSCKVTLDDKPFFYVINYRMYNEETQVRSFSKEAFERNQELVDSTGKELSFEHKLFGNITKKTANLAADDSLVIDLPEGNHAISTIHLDIDSKGNKQMNRAVVLLLTFDGKRTVWSPVAEFFGGGVYARSHKNRQISVTKDGVMKAEWMMSYRKTAKLILKNYGEESTRAEVKVATKEYDWNERSMYFHADWHEEDPLNTPPFKDWNLIKIRGKGVYVGDVLTVYSKNKQWWGEGDEKIYIDGEEFPSHLGTGTEDYYGYAWGMANFFSSPFISMPQRDARGKDDWRGYTTVSRVRLLDGIPFTTALKLDLEAWQTVGGTSYSTTSFWYARPNAMDNIEPDELTILRDLPEFAGFEYERVPGKQFADPARDGSIPPSGNGSIRHVGNQIDMLEWKNSEVEKTFDVDGDNQLGTKGFHLIGVKRYDHRNQKFIADSARTLPGFVSILHMENITHSLQDAWLKIPSKSTISYITGKIEVTGAQAVKHLLTFEVTKKVPRSFRLGIMLDNAGSFEKVGKYLRITSNNGGDSGNVPLARSNRVPDWYFFDVTGLGEDDTITITGRTKNNNDLFTLGAITFDVPKP